MDYNKRLVEYTIAKRGLIHSVTGGNYLYCTKKDIDEIKTWAQEDCRRALRSLFHSSSYSCPWCLNSIDNAFYNYKKDCYYNGLVNCNRCGYKKRNGICGSNPNSRFGKIIVLINKSDKNFFLSANLKKLIARFKIK